MRVATVDIGTVSSRLLLATLEDGRIAAARKRTQITDLGEGVDATGRLADAAIGRVLHTCAAFRDDITAFNPRATVLTLTSAARDAENGDELLDGLVRLGFSPQIIPGEVEGWLTFFGVARDFAGERIAVADSGGGSTELVTGCYELGRPLVVDALSSLNVGCRRMTERFNLRGPVDEAALEPAGRWARELLDRYWGGLDERPGRLVAVGGTVTTLVAMEQGMVSYDSSRVHLSTLTLEQVAGAVGRLSECTVEEIACLPGVQPKRAPVLLGGALIVRELMRAGGYEELTVSENSLMAGMAATIYETVSRSETTIGWKPAITW